MTRQRLPVLIHLILAASFLVMLLLQPVLVDTKHMDDTVFLANLGWRGVHGLRPVIDYPHFYGGVTAQFVTWAFQLFGATYYAINYAFAMMGVACVATLWALGWQRLPSAGLALLTAISSALLLSLLPIELGFINRPQIAHSFAYNHAAIVLMMAITVFCLQKARSRKVEMATALLAGIVVYALALLKPTFAVFGPCVVLACLIQARRLSAAFVVLGACAGMLVMDPGMVRFFGSLNYLLGSMAAESTSLAYFLVRIAGIMIRQAWAIIFIGWLMLRYNKSGMRMILAVLVLMCGYGAAILTMNSSADLILLPILTVIGLKCRDVETDGGKDRRPRQDFLVRILPATMAYFIILPAFVCAASALGLSVINRDASLVASGPAKDYVVLSLEDLKPGADTGVLADRADETRQDVPENGTEKDKYTMFSDGIALLQGIPAMKTHGIISNGRQFDFTMPTGSRPVASFPVWPTTNLVYFTDPSPLPDDVDTVMISIDWPRQKMVNRELITKMGEEFRVCRRSSLWTLYVRRNIPEDLCYIAD
ncbi:hypothetical protein [Loktanella sp. M215]|uniref:hypothetical protein n=1 Tax=Loktanella sp. M215 TaxID=2675431 RepID=UPI001F3E3D25|nr:hypothetical protein [Loktanella sp. M215]MCF7698612.1 hypothetical protein [Loktanella sp. M215]